MNALLAISLALIGPCGSAHEPAESDAIALVEVVGDFRKDAHWRFTTSSWGLDRGTRAVVVKAVAEGAVTIGQRLDIKTVRPWSDPPEITIDRKPLRPFGVDLYVGEQLDGWPNEKCSLPDELTGQRVFVALEEGRLVDWWLPKSMDARQPEPRSYHPPRSDSSPPIAELSAVVMFHGPTDDWFLGSSEDERWGPSVYAHGIVKHPINGSVEIDEVVGVELIAKTFDMNPFSVQRQSYPRPADGVQSTFVAVKLGALLRPTCFVHLAVRRPGRSRDPNVVVPVPSDYSPGEAFRCDRIAARLDDPATLFRARRIATPANGESSREGRAG